MDALFDAVEGWFVVNAALVATAALVWISVSAWARQTVRYAAKKAERERRRREPVNLAAADALIRSVGGEVKERAA